MSDKIENDWAIVREWAVQFDNNGRGSRCIMDLDRRLSAIEQREARREKPAEKPQPQPGAGVETAEVFAKRVCNSQVLTEWGKTCELAARDAQVAAAARAKAIDQAEYAACKSLEQESLGDSAIKRCLEAIRTLKEQG